MELIFGMRADSLILKKDAIAAFIPIVSPIRDEQKLKSTIKGSEVRSVF